MGSEGRAIEEDRQDTTLKRAEGGKRGELKGDPSLSLGDGKWPSNQQR